MTVGSLPSLFVLVPTHNRVSLLERTVDSLLACERPADRDVRVVVVENGTKAGTEELLRGKVSWLRPEYRYHAQPNKSEAQNLCVDEAGDSLVVFLDDDVRVTPGLLVEYAKAAGDRRSGAIFGGGMLIDYETAPPRWLADYLPPSARGWHPQTYAPVSKGMPFPGCNWAAFAPDVRATGGFNPLFGPGGVNVGTGEDREMQAALTGRGCETVYVRDAIVWHYVPQDRCSTDWALQREFRNAIYKGFEMQAKGRAHHFAGVPIHLMLRAVIQSANALKARISGSERQRFVAMHALMTTRGMIRGARNHYLKRPVAEQQTY